MNQLFAAQSGWGKGWTCQAYTETNTEEYDHVAVLDYKDEYRGLVKAGFAKHWIAGPKERGWTADAWRSLLESNPKVVIARHGLTEDHWSEVCAKIAKAARSLAGANSVLVVVDEAHFVAPQGGKLDPALKGLATTGRGENCSSMWVTQRLQELHETVIAQCQSRMLGGFQSDRDLRKIDVEYPREVHRPGASELPYLPDALHAPDAGPVPLRKFEDDHGDTVGSEWIYSDDSGTLERIDTRQVRMESTHYGRQGKPLRRPPTHD